MTVIRIGTGTGELALARTRQVAARLGEYELVEAAAGSSTLVDALREALLAGEVDVVVQAFVDLPAQTLEGVEVAAVPKRGDARDAFCAAGGGSPAALPAGARIGARGPLRRARILSAHAGAEIVDIDGEEDSALLGRLGSDETSLRLDALLVAAADLRALGRADAATEMLDLADWPTAPGQGALAVEIRADAPREIRRRASGVDHRASRLAVAAERAVLGGFAERSAAPLAAHAMLDDGLLFLTATAYAPDGSQALTSSHAGYPEDAADPAAELAGRVVEELLSLGAEGLAPSH